VVTNHNTHVDTQLGLSYLSVDCLYQRVNWPNILYFIVGSLVFILKNATQRCSRIVCFGNLKRIAILTVGQYKEMFEQKGAISHFCRRGPHARFNNSPGARSFTGPAQYQQHRNEKSAPASAASMYINTGITIHACSC
jgi:hypothetical protein